MKKILFTILPVFIFLNGCASTQTSNSNSDRVSVGTVQKSIKIGMSGAEVAAVMGSPNIVSTDGKRREVWIYDKISQDVQYNRSSAYGTLLLIGGNSSSGSASSSQKTLTVIVKFDESNKVRDFAYHTSRF